MNDARLVAVRGACKGLEAVQRGGWNESVVRVGESDYARNFRADGLRVVVIEDKAVDVVGQKLDIADKVGLV